jgi:hypothetical protein
VTKATLVGHQGLYNPLTDRVFLLGLIANTAVPFSLAAFVTTRIDARASYIVLAVGCTSLVLLHGWVLFGATPARIKGALLLELGTAIIATIVVVAAQRSRH